MKSPIVHPQALAELREQAVFYEGRSSGLGERLAAQVEAAINLAVSMPAIGQPCRHGTRRVFPKDFLRTLASAGKQQTA